MGGRLRAAFPLAKIPQNPKALCNMDSLTVISSGNNPPKQPWSPE